MMAMANSVAPSGVASTTSMSITFPSASRRTSVVTEATSSPSMHCCSTVSVSSAAVAEASPSRSDLREEAEADGRWRRRLKRSSTAVVAVAEALAFASWMPEVVGTFAWLAAEVEGMALGEEGGLMGG